MTHSTVDGKPEETSAREIAPPSARAVEFDPELRDRLAAYRDKLSLNNSELGRLLDAHATAVSKYLNGKPEGDVVKLEAKIADVLKNAFRSADQRISLFETNITRTIAAVAESLRRMGGVGLLYGATGVGKTCGCELYLATNPTTIGLSIAQWDRSPNRVENLLFDAVDASNGPRAARARWMVERLKRSRRLIIVDNAQRMTLASRRFLVDFAEATGCPLLLVGEPTLLDGFREDKEIQTFVRIKRELMLKDPAEAAAQMLGAEGVNQGLLTMATQVVGERGHLRALSHQLALTRDILTDGKFQGGAVQAFLSAHTQMLCDYRLTAPALNGKGGK